MADKEKHDNKLKGQGFTSLDKAAKQILSMLDSGYTERSKLTKRNYALQKIINREIDNLRGVADGNIIDFIMSMDIRNTGIVDREFGKRNPMFDNIFVEHMGDIFSYFQQSYKNRFLEMSDLKMISKFIPSMGKAVSVILNSIVNSDDMSSSIIREIAFPPGTSPTDKDAIMREIEAFEKEKKLKKKLKKSVYKKTLIAGTYYIYVTPMKKIFFEFDKLLEEGIYSRDASGFVSTNNFGRTRSFNIKMKKDRNSNKAPGMESMCNLDAIMESFNSSGWTKEDKNAIEQDILSNEGGNFYIYSETPILFEALEGYISKAYNNTFNGIPKGITPTSKAPIAPDGSYAISDNEYSRKDISYKTDEKNQYDDISGAYIKYIDAKYIVPCIIFDEKIGYFYVKPTPGKNTSIMTPNFSVDGKSSPFINQRLSDDKKDRAVATIADRISEGIIQNYGPKFVHEHMEYKQLIAECLISNGFANNDYHVQFIPAEDIVEFIINEDEDGNGESILADSLYQARLLFDLITAKLLNYFNNSGNTTYAHVHKGPIGSNADNQIERVLRMLQETNINFNDLLSTNAIFSKFTRDKNIQLPTSRNGTKIVEFETQEGQDIDLSTPMEERLEKMAIQGTKVPASFMDRIDDVQYSRQIISDHIELAEEVSGLQEDLEEPTTQLYRKLLACSSLTPEQMRIAQQIEVKLPRPKALQNVNSSEFIENTNRSAESIAKLYYGENPKENVLPARDKFMKSVCKENAPYIPWERYDELFEESKIDAEKDANYAEKSDDGGF